jgi:4a-hydroxytetrahydrobiopterin dehydratase
MTTSCDLADRTCEPCRGGVPPLEADAANVLLGQLGGGWSINAAGHLERLYTFKNFIQAMNFANRIGDVAEEAGHHPDLYVAWGRCGIEIWTHKIDGLAEADFILAAKAARIYDDGL